MNLIYPYQNLFMNLCYRQLTKQNCQVVNLGAGSDTHFWNLADEGLLPKKWIEVDFDGIVNHKIYTIRSRKPLLEKIATAGYLLFSFFPLNNSELKKIEIVNHHHHHHHHHLFILKMSTSFHDEHRVGCLPHIKSSSLHTPLFTAQ